MLCTPGERVKRGSGASPKYYTRVYEGLERRLATVHYVVRYQNF